MKIVDANVLIYAVNEDSPFHARAHRWLDDVLGGEEAVGFAWIVLLAFLRLTTRQGLFVRPLDPGVAAETIEQWLQQRPAVVVSPTNRHASILRGLLEPTGVGGNLVNDAHLAALSVEYGAEIISFDGDFARFPGVRWQLPG